MFLLNLSAPVAVLLAIVLATAFSIALFYIVHPFWAREPSEDTNKTADIVAMRLRVVYAVVIRHGDTVEVMHDGKAERIRLAQIDCPGKNQPFGQADKRYVLDVVAHKIVTVEVATVDRYGRTIGEVFLSDGSNFNKQIVGAGYAWQYKRHSKDPESGDLEEKVRAAGLGLWQGKSPIPPWEWRRGQRHQILHRHFA